MEDYEQRTATVEYEEQRPATVEDDEQRSATAPGRAELQIGEQSFRSASRTSDWRASIDELYFRLASFNRQALLQIGIAFFMTGKEREKNSVRRKKKKKRRKRRRDGEMER